MCGIAGIVALAGAPPPELARLRAMAATLVHRGPDDEGALVLGAAGLAMRRLAIIDPAGGAQPMANRDGTVHVVSNGEIYDFRALRHELEGLGHRFASRSDTEVIVHAYEEWGIDFPCRLGGMFAIAVWDARRRRLVLCRDPLGVKPLFYAFSGGYLVFGSELGAVLASGLVPRTLDRDALAEFLCWEYVPGAGTLLGAVRKLEPGQRLVLEPAAAPRIDRYWDVPGAPEERDVALDEWVERVDATLAECVKSQLVSDVPLGAFLSGGVDSSLVVAHMGGARAFGIGFADPSYDELPWARRVAAHLGTPLDEEIVRPDVVGLFDHLMDHLDDPIGDFSIFPTFLVSRLARKHVTVVLSGDGGDELFGGYETYLAQGWWRLYRRLPGALRRSLVEPFVRSLQPRPEKKGLVNKMRRFVEGAALDPALGHARWRAFAGDALRHELLLPEVEASLTRPVVSHILALEARAAGRDAVNRALYVDLRSYLCDDILVKVDRMSMANSLEARVPYLDTRMVELAFRIPGELKVRRGTTKRLLKRVAARHLPAAWAERPKEGFSVPIKHWLGSELRPALGDLLSPERLRARGLFDLGAIARLRDEHLSGRENHSHLLWSLMVFEAWCRRWLDAPPRATAAAAA
jgi:asparagine synthase (glutamine-hydrolysing)